MIINDRSVVLADFEVENINGELIIYNAQFKKIIILNETSSFVWESIYKSNSVGNSVYSIDIVNEIKRHFVIRRETDEVLLNDVEECINKLFDR